MKRGFEGEEKEGNNKRRKEEEEEGGEKERGCVFGDFARSATLTHTSHWFLGISFNFEENSSFPFYYYHYG